MLKECSVEITPFFPLCYVRFDSPLRIYRGVHRARSTEQYVTWFIEAIERLRTTLLCFTHEIIRYEEW